MQPNALSTQAVSDKIAGRIDMEAAKGMSLTPMAGGAAFVPKTVNEVMEFAKMMSVAGIAVRKHLRNNPGACLAVSMQAARWSMDPFAVGNKSYEVNDQLAFESQLINAVLNTRAPIKGRIRFSFEGEGGSRKCTASAKLAEVDEEPVSVTSPTFANIQPKNSPLWKSDPDQQLSYYTSRLLARRYFPEVLLGVYDVEELQTVGESTVMPANRPTRQQANVIDASPTSEPVAVINAFGEVTGEYYDEAAYAKAIAAAIAETDNADALNAVLEHNADGIDTLSETHKAAISSALDAANSRLRSVARNTGEYPATGEAVAEEEQPDDSDDRPALPDGFTIEGWLDQQRKAFAEMETPEDVTELRKMQGPSFAAVGQHYPDEVTALDAEISKRTKPKQGDLIDAQ